MASRVDLVLPGLFNLPSAEIDPDIVSRQLPSLNHLLRFGHQQSNNLFEMDSILADCLGLDGFQILPFASAFAGEKDAGQGNHLLCRAVHLKPDMRNAFVIPLHETAEEFDHIDILINDLGDLFKPDCDLTKIDDGLWFMRLRECQPPSHYPHYLSIVGRKVDQYIEQSRTALPWYQLMNEMQMFLHSHEVNQKRLLNGLLPINSLWCWGAGEFIQPQSTQKHWYCDELTLKAYAEKSNIEQSPVSVLAHTDLNDDSLIVDLRLLDALKSPDAEDLSEILLRLESELFKPLLNRIKSGQVHLRLRAGHENDLSISSASRFRFWKKNTGLIDWLS
ncbi:MAG: hypothetical protein OEY09_06055 [Gammaproteobacteria bacterium]|nr:hypothetical protein [Gammaproteobacteria bacterium]